MTVKNLFETHKDVSTIVLTNHGIPLFGIIGVYRGLTSKRQLDTVVHDVKICCGDHNKKYIICNIAA